MLTQSEVWHDALDFVAEVSWRCNVSCCSTAGAEQRSHCLDISATLLLAAGFTVVLGDPRATTLVVPVALTCVPALTRRGAMQVNIAGVVVSDLVLSVTVPFLVYWATALFYEALAYVRIPWVEQYRIHPAAAEKQYNLVWCLPCLASHCGLAKLCCTSSCCGTSLSLDCAYRQRQRHAQTNSHWRQELTCKASDTCGTARPIAQYFYTQRGAKPEVLRTHGCLWQWRCHRIVKLIARVACTSQ